MPVTLLTPASVGDQTTKGSHAYKAMFYQLSYFPAPSENTNTLYISCKLFNGLLFSIFFC